MSAIIRNDFRRLWYQKQLVVLLVIFTVIASLAAIFVSKNLNIKWDIAVVSGRPVSFKGGNVNLILLDKAPKQSTLVSGKYDAVLYRNADGSYKIDTIKSEETTAQMTAALKGDVDILSTLSSRGIGTNILGFLMMFLLLMGSMAMCMYSDDKEQKQINCVAASPLRSVPNGGNSKKHPLFWTRL